ncbi:MAG TPA: choice-of-anchor D domain-containing protein, partial [Usitatibacteraceae bacterium]|nr:choice-of-anchor D domain-containing protein [Usitatibacteraceae bacterium]
MDGAKVVSAAFTLQRHALVLTKDGTGTGAVTSSPAGIDCGPDCEGEWDHGTVVTLTATADATSTFRQFDGDCVGAGPQCTVTMTAARAVTASFAIRQHALSVSVSGTGSGTVTSTPAGISCAGDCNEDYGHGTVVTLSAAPSADSVFAGWTGACAGTGECMVTMTDARSVTATFTLKQFTLTVAKQGAGSGAVTSSPAGIDCGADCAEAYDIGTAVVLTATPAPGSAFVGWSGSCAGTGACNVTMTSTRSVTASFAGAPVMGVLPGLVTFTPRQVGTTSAEQVITVSNTGTAPLSVSISGANAIEFPRDGTCVSPPPAPIAPGGSCTVTVSFAPQATGARNGTVVVNGDDPLNPTVNVALSGTGIDEIPDAFSFPAATGVAPGAEVTSAAATITGISPSAPVTVTGGSYSIGCTGTFTSAGGTIANGQTVCVRHVASAGYATQVTTTLTIGGVSADFTSTTVAAPVVATRGDANGDGRSDLFWRTAAPGTGLSWWTMNGASATAANYHDVDPAWQVADVGDLDGDGKADLVWRRASDGATYLWLLDGFVFKGFADLGVLD